jgi:hypothetical protein
VPDDSETASTSDEAPDWDADAEDVVSVSLFCSSARYNLDWWNVRERYGMEDWKLVTRGVYRIWRGAATARAAARRKMYL